MNRYALRDKLCVMMLDQAPHLGKCGPCDAGILSFGEEWLLAMWGVWQLRPPGFTKSLREALNIGHP